MRSVALQRASRLSSGKRLLNSPSQKAPDEINRLMALSDLYTPTRIPRNPIALCHGLYGFDTWTAPLPSFLPSLEFHYWADVLDILRLKFGVKVIIPGVPGTGSVEDRAAKMHDFLKKNASGMDINFLSHSLGGLDARHLFSVLRPTEYTPISLTTVSTPHHGSEFMDWLAANIGIGSASLKGGVKLKEMAYTLQSPLLAGLSTKVVSDVKAKAEEGSSVSASVSKYILDLLDSPAYSNLTTAFADKVFNPATPDVAGIRYFSIGARKDLSIYHPLWFPQTIINRATKGSLGNDGLVSIESARWGEFLGIVEDTDHFDLKGGRGFPKTKLEKEASSNGSTWAWVDLNKLFRLWSNEQSTSNAKKQKEDTPSPVLPEGAASEKSTLSTVSSAVAYVAESLPSSLQLGMSKAEAAEEKAHHENESKKSTAVAKADMERFFAAICRKLYDEGL